MDEKEKDKRLPLHNWVLCPKCYIITYDPKTCMACGTAIPSSTRVRMINKDKQIFEITGIERASKYTFPALFPASPSKDKKSECVPEVQCPHDERCACFYYLRTEKVRKLEAAKDAEKEAAKDADVSHELTTEIKGSSDILQSKIEELTAPTDKEYQALEGESNIQLSKTEGIVSVEENAETDHQVEHMEAYRVKGEVKRTYECIKKKRKEINEAEQKLAMKLQEEIQKILELREKEERIKLLESNPNDPDNPLNSKIPFILELIPDSGSNSIYLPDLMKGAFITKESLTTLIDNRLLNDEVIDSYNIYLSNVKYPGIDNFKIFSTLFLQSVRRHIKPDGTGNIKRVLRPRNLNIFDIEFLIIPVNVQQVHWCFLLVHNLKNLQYFGKSIPNDVQNY